LPQNIPFSGRDLLSIDVEDYFHVEAFAGSVSRDDWPKYESRVRKNTERILALLEQYGQKATFFILGWVAEREPSLVRAIANGGHEVACHSYAHQRVFTLTPQEFRSDLRRAKAVIEDAAGQQLFGYRAPTFSICKESLWALEILAGEGFLYDSSIFPIRHDLYGMPDSPRFPHKRILPGGEGIVEIPASVTRRLGVNWPVAGGGYLRHLPMQYTRAGMRQIHKHQQPVNVYFHPWEIDPDQPRIAARWKSRFRHYRGLHKTEPRLCELLEGRRFEPMIEFVRRFLAIKQEHASANVA
jgi:polysaccharide deacetylase family protein (PEP-CTERM system associated)